LRLAASWKGSALCITVDCISKPSPGIKLMQENLLPAAIGRQLGKSVVYYFCSTIFKK